MGNLQDYVRWRGDLTFAERPFNLIDNLVLSALAYLDLEGVVPGPQAAESVTVAEAAERHARRDAGSTDPRRLDIVPESLLADLAASARFGGARLSRYVDVVDAGEWIQFAALTIGLDDDTNYVAYRGTDMTIVGWREDFVMSFEVMPSQRLAADYLGDVLAGTRGDVLVGGHSKGGNLALYAAAHADADHPGRIRAVYSNDGPGLGPEAAEPALLERLGPRLVRIGPQFCIVGMLFNDAPPEWIVASDARGLMQHDIMTWQVEADRLRTEQMLAPAAVEIDRAVAGYLDEAGPDERRAVTEAIFGSLAAGGAVLLQDLATAPGAGGELVLLGLLRSRGQLRKPVEHGVRTVRRRLAALDYPAVLREAATLRLGLVAALGLFLIVAPEVGTQVLAVVAVAGLILMAVWWLGRLGVALARRYRLRGWRVLALGCVVAALLALLAWASSLFLTVNLFVGACLVVGAWTSIGAGLAALNRSRRRVPRAVALFVNAGAALLFGSIALTAAEVVVPFYIRTVGQYLLTVAAVGLLLAIWEGLSRALDGVGDGPAPQ